MQHFCNLIIVLLIYLSAASQTAVERYSISLTSDPSHLAQCSLIKQGSNELIIEIQTFQYEVYKKQVQDAQGFMLHMIYNAVKTNTFASLIPVKKPKGDVLEMQVAEGTEVIEIPKIQTQGSNIDIGKLLQDFVTIKADLKFINVNQISNSRGAKNNLNVFDYQRIETKFKFTAAASRLELDSPIIFEFREMVKVNHFFLESLVIPNWYQQDNSNSDDQLTLTNRTVVLGMSTDGKEWVTETFELVAKETLRIIKKLPTNVIKYFSINHYASIKLYRNTSPHCGRIYNGGSYNLNYPDKCNFVLRQPELTYIPDY